MRLSGMKFYDIPSGMGGTLPAVVASEGEGDSVQVICMHPEFYTNWVLTVKRENLKPLSYTITEAMKKIVKSRGQPC